MRHLRDVWTTQKDRTPQHLVWMGWNPPPGGWIQINVDGCVKADTGMAGGGGGILRDDKGAWKGGFSVILGICTTIEAELWG